MNPAEEYILKQKEPFKSILLHLQMVIQHTISDAEMKYKWHLPCFYVGKRPLCYLNTTHDYVDVGFWHSAYLGEFSEYLVGDKRKIVKSLRYRSLEDIDDEVLIAILKLAYQHRDKSFYK